MERYMFQQKFLLGSGTVFGSKTYSSNFTYNYFCPNDRHFHNEPNCV